MESNENYVSSDEIFNAPKKTHKLNMWQSFGVFKRGGQLNKTHAICECRAAIKYISSTTNLATHMKRRHGVDATVASPPSSPSATPSGSKAGDTSSRSIASFFGQNTPLAANSAKICSPTVS